MVDRLSLPSALIALWLAAPAAHAQYAFEALALEGETAPGTGALYDRVYGPASLDDGAHGFFAEPDAAPAPAIWVDVGSGVQLVTRRDDPAPVPGGETFMGFSTPQVFGSGKAVFEAQYTQGVSGWAYGLFLWEAGSITPLLLDGEPVSGTPWLFEVAYNPRVNASGEVVFEGTVKDVTGTSAGGIFRLSDGVLEPLVWRYDTPAPGGGLFNQTYSPVINDAGVVAFVGGGTEYGIYRVDGGQIVQMLSTDDVLPGTGGGRPDERLFTGGTIDINASGAVAFRTAITGGSVYTGIFRVSAGGAVTPIVVHGQAAPPGSSGVFDSLYPHPVIADDGSVAFVATLTAGGYQSNGLFIGDGRAIRPVARTGDPAPGTGGGVFSTLPQRALAMSGGGRIAFVSRVFEGSAPRGLFLATPVPPAVPALPPWSYAPGVLLLAGWGGRALARRRGPRASAPPA